MSVIIYVALPCCGYKTYHYNFPCKEGNRVSISCPHGKVTLQVELEVTQKQH